MKRLWPLVFLGCTGYVHAQEPEAVAASLPAVTITAKPEGGASLARTAKAGSRLGLTLRETPASVEVITEETMAQRGARTLEEALRGAVGITVGGNPTSPGLASTRGVTSGFISYLFDGLRIATPTMSNRPQDSWNYERIEVLKGPASVLYGEGAIGGAVNFVPKQPDRNAAGVQALLSYGSHEAVRLGIGAGGPIGETGAYRLDLSHNESEGWIDRTAQRLDHLTGALKFALTPSVVADVSVDYLQDDIDPYFGTPLVPRSFAAEPTDVVSDSAGRVVDKRLARTNYNVRDGLAKADSLWVRSRVSWDITPQWRLRNELGHYTADRHWRNAESLSFVAPGFIERDHREVKHDHEVLSNRLDIGHEGQLAGYPNRFVAGIEFSRTDFATQRRSSNGAAGTNELLRVSAIDPVVGFYNMSPSLRDGPGNRLDLTADVGTTAFFVEDALRLGERFTAVAGVRTERIKLERTVRDLDSGAASPFSAFNTTYKPTTVRIGGVFDLSKTKALYAQFVDAAAPVGSANLLLMSSANARFPLTRGRQWEAGLKQSLPDARVDWTLALYRIEQSDVLSRDPDRPAVAVNNGEISSQGIELSAAWRPVRGLSLSGNFAAVDAQFDTFVEAGGVSRVGNRPPMVPRTVTNLWADYRCAEMPLTLGIGVQGTGDMYTNNANTVRINGHWLADAYASWRASQVLWTLRVRNLTDELYATWAGANESNQVMLGAPRTVELSARFDF